MDTFSAPEVPSEAYTMYTRFHVYIRSMFAPQYRVRKRLSVRNADRAERGVRALLYVRVSTDKQANHGTSLDAQQERLVQECHRRGVKDYRVVVESGVSGSQESRPGLDEVLRLLKAGEYNLLLVTDLDRLARSTIHTLHLSELATRQGWDLAVLGGHVQFDTSTPQGRLILTVIAGFAEFERDMIRQRTRNSFAHKRLTGGTGLIPGDVEDRVVALHDQRLSLRGIADRLVAESLPTAKGGAWTAATVRRVLVRKGMAAELVKRGS